MAAAKKKPAKAGTSMARASPMRKTTKMAGRRKPAAAKRNR
jgi:hypothetical protein